MIGNKIADKTTKASRSWPQNSLGTVENELENLGFHRKIPKKRCISPEKKTENSWWSKTNDIIMQYQKIIDRLDNTTS